MVGIVLVASCASTALQSSQLRTPKSLAELLVNIKQATQSGLILQDDFYTEDSLKRAFGGSSAQISVAYNGVRTGARVESFPAWPEVKTAESGTQDSLTLDITRSFDINGGPRTNLNLESTTGTTLTQSRIELLLGKDWQRRVPMSMAYGGGPIIFDQPYIYYDLGDPSLLRSLSIRFAPDDTFKSARAAANQH